MKTLKSLILVASCLCAVRPAVADTIVLKNGESLVGRVLREDGDDYVIEIKVSNTIRDEKRIAKSEVQSIEKEEADVTAFKKIEDLVPTPELLDVAAYEERIAKIRGYIESHPKSAGVSKAQEMLLVLDAELETVKEGGIKFGEEMVAPDDYKANAYEYDAVIAARNIKESVNRRDLISALRLFSVYDMTFADAEGRDVTVGLIRQVLAAYLSSLGESIASYDGRIEKRTAGLKQMTPEDRAKTERALEDQQARLTARFEAEKEAKESWVTPDAFHKESLEEAKRQAESEMNRLESATGQAPLETPLAEAYRDAWNRLAGGSDEEKKALLAKLKTDRMPEKYLVMLTERAGLPTE